MANRVSGMVAVLSSILLYGSYAAVVLMVLHVCFDVLSRYVFHVAPVGTLEISSYYYLVPLCFLPLAAVERKNQHIAVEAFSHFLPKPVLGVLDRIVMALCILVLGLYVWRTGMAAWRYTQVREFVETIYFRLPVWPIRWLIPLSLCAMALVIVLRFLGLAGTGNDTRAKPQLDTEA